VTYVRNITDIDDKIIRARWSAASRIRALTDEMIAAMHRDFAALGTAAHARAARHRVRAADAGIIGTLEARAWPTGPRAAT
jgi:cysteinyl-tRNA synthetase